MVVAKTEISTAISEWLDHEMEQSNGFLPKAAEAVAKRVISEGRAEELVREHGTWIMSELWQGPVRLPDGAGAP